MNKIFKIIADRELKNSEKILVIVMLLRYNNYGLSRVKNAQLVNETGLSRVTVKNAIARLEQLNYIKRKYIYEDSGKISYREIELNL